MNQISVYTSGTVTSHQQTQRTWVFVSGPDDPPTAGVREPRRPLPSAPPGAVEILEETR